MGSGIPLTALTALFAAAADLPDTSERFREAMSACTLPGPELRRDRLARTGWTAAPPDAEDAQAFRDAALLEIWPNREAGPVALPETIYRHGTARLILGEDAAGNPTCRLAAQTSEESDRLFAALARADAVTEAGPIRRAAMVTTVLDFGTDTWRTEVTLTSANTDAANAALAEPLRTTLAVFFVTRPVP